MFFSALLQLELTVERVAIYNIADKLTKSKVVKYLKVR